MCLRSNISLKKSRLLETASKSLKHTAGSWKRKLFLKPKQIFRTEISFRDRSSFIEPQSIIPKGKELKPISASEDGPWNRSRPEVYVIPIGNHRLHLLHLYLAFSGVVCYIAPSL